MRVPHGRPRGVLSRAVFLAVISSIASVPARAWGQTDGTGAPSTPTRAPELIEPTAEAEVTVQGQRNEAEQLQDSAEAVTVVDLRRAKQQTADLGEVLARTPGVNIRRTGGLGSDTIIALNGLQGDQIGIFVDGVPEEYSGYPGGIVNIPVNIVERVEIYRGVVPARFGLDALGGAINVVTTRGGRSYLNASYQTGSYGVNRLNSSGRYQRNGLIVGGNAFFDVALNNYIMSDRQLPNPDGSSITMDTSRFHNRYRAYGGHLEAGVMDKPWAKRLLGRVFASRLDNEIQTNATMTIPYGEVTSGETTFGGSIQYEVEIIPQLELEALLNYAHRQIDFDDLGKYKYSWTGQIARPIGTRGDVRGEVNGTPTDNESYENLYLARLGLLAEFNEHHSARVYATPQYVTRTTRSFVPGVLNHDLVDDALQFVAGAEYEQSFFDDRLSNVVLGKYYYFEPTKQSWITREGFDPFVQEATGHTHAGGGGDSLRYKFTDWILAKASYEYAIRLPSPDELFGNGVFIESNAELKPERSHNFNLGPRVELRDTPAGSVVADINGFWRETKDMIALIVTEQLAPYSNIGNARSAGVEGSLWWQSPGRWVTLDGSLTWMDSINTSKDGPFASTQGERIPSRPYRFASWGGRLHVGSWPHGDDSLDLFYMGRYVHGFLRGWESHGNPRYQMSVPDQVSHAVGITYTTRLLDTGRYSATFEVDNLTNAELYDVWGVQRPGRSFNFKISAQL